MYSQASRVDSSAYERAGSTNRRNRYLDPLNRNEIWILHRQSNPTPPPPHHHSQFPSSNKPHLDKPYLILPPPISPTLQTPPPTRGTPSRTYSPLPRQPLPQRTRHHSRHDRDTRYNRNPQHSLLRHLVVNQLLQTAGLEVGGLLLEEEVVVAAGFRVVAELVVAEGEVVDAFAAALVVLLEDLCCVYVSTLVSSIFVSRFISSTRPSKLHSDRKPRIRQRQRARTSQIPHPQLLVQSLLGLDQSPRVVEFRLDTDIGPLGLELAAEHSEFGFLHRATVGIVALASIDCIALLFPPLFGMLDRVKTLLKGRWMLVEECGGGGGSYLSASTASTLR